MPNLVHVLVQDGAGKVPPGYVISESRELAALQLRGSVVLPVDDDLVPTVSGFALDGFQIRHWGSGFPATKGSGERICPMVLRVHPNRTNVYWACRVAPVKGERASGRFRLVGDSTHTAFISAGLSHSVQPPLLEETPLDAAGGWTLRGCSTINVVTEGLLAMSIYAVALRARVLWSAVSVSSFAGVE